MSKFGFRAGSVVKDWVTDLPLRMQGVLMSSVRGCDSVPKQDGAKHLQRAYRGLILNTPAKKPSSFIDYVSGNDLGMRMRAVLDDHDHYPVHYVLHLMHSVEIIGYFYPEPEQRARWEWFYKAMCSEFHLNPETKEQLIARMTATEAEFAEGAQTERDNEDET